MSTLLESICQPVEDLLWLFNFSLLLLPLLEIAFLHKWGKIQLQDELKVSNS